MEKENCKVPVLFLIFKRMEAVDAFKPIKEYKPARLYIAADGPRNSVNGEKEDCERVRQAVLNLIDWPCEVKTLFREKNLGCAHAINEGISWFFEHEEYGIINEDDVVLSPDYFLICEQLLPHYKAIDKVMEISAYNYVPLESVTNSFVFTNSHYCWGWATWARAWRKMDMTLKFWPSLSLFKLVKAVGLFQGLHSFYCGQKAYKDPNALDSWDFRWHLAILYYDGLVMLPNTNLSKNIGMSSEGTHYKKGDKDLYAHLSVGRISFPLELPSNIEMSKRQHQGEKRDFLRIRMYGLKKMLRIV